MDKDTVIECRSLWKAEEELQARGVAYDQIYQNISREAVTDWASGRGGVAARVSDVHYYFNNGNGLNVAYFTPSMEVLRIFATPRIDGTPVENRSITQPTRY